ncbi:MAG: SH3 domain-containing protein [Candidatus Nitrotoga sp.]
MTRLWTQSDKLCGLFKARADHMLCGMVTVLLGFTITGCALQKPAPVATPIPPPERYEVQQREIKRLQQLLAEKEVQIRNMNARQQDQAKALQLSTNQVTREQVRIRRLATMPGAASSIAEAEVAMASLKLDQFTAPEQTLQAQRLLDAATKSYAKGNYGAAMNHAEQSREFIEMLKDNRTGKSTDPRLAMVLFNIPIPLRTKSNINLRQEPFSNAAKLAILKKDTALTVHAYLGDWLNVQISNERSGWVLNTLVEVWVGDLNH